MKESYEQSLRKLNSVLRVGLEEYLDMLEFYPIVNPILKEEPQNGQLVTQLLILDAIKYHQLLDREYDQSERMFNRSFEFLQTVLTSVLIEQKLEFQFKNNLILVNRQKGESPIQLKPAISYDPRRFIKNKDELHRAIQYYSADSQSILTDFYLLVQSRVKLRDEQTSGGFSKALELLWDIEKQKQDGLNRLQLATLLYELNIVDLYFNGRSEQDFETKVFSSIQSFLNAENAPTEIRMIDEMSFIPTVHFENLLQQVA